MSKIYGIVTATVKDRNSQGQVRVQYPWLPGDDTGYWAPIATMMAGVARGSWFMPEIGDDVLVAFEQGDFDHPYVVGFLWNGQNQPPSGDPQQRMLRSVNGHMIEIYDPDVGSDGEKGYIRLRDAYGNEIVLQNSAITITGKGSITIDAPDVRINGRPVVTASSPI
jgi:uncharacterized protein involved in type VI secretion and phage assembly